MSSFLSGGGRTYGFDLEIVKSPSTSIRTSLTSSSSSSTLSESSNSPLAISTRKPRTPRKRQNQTYNEAAALLSTAYPKIFSAKQLTNPRKFSKLHDSFFDESEELLLPLRVFDNSGFMLHQPFQEKPNFRSQPKVGNLCEKGEIEFEFQQNSGDLCDGYEEDFDAESILDEEIEEGIDSIMGNPRENKNTDAAEEYNSLGYGGNFESGIWTRSGVRAFRHLDEGNWWCFPTVDVLEICPKFNKVSVSEKKKKKKKVEKAAVVKLKNSAAPPPKEESNSSGLKLKLNYENVLNSWSDRGAPFSDEIFLGSEIPTRDDYVRLLFLPGNQIPGNV